MALVVAAAGPGGFGGLGSEGALRVVEAVEALKAWADSVAVEATAVMVGGFETDFVHLAPELALTPFRGHLVREDVHHGTHTSGVYS